MSEHKANTVNQEYMKQSLLAYYEEYKTLRAEYAQHLLYQHQILQLTLALCAVVASPKVWTGTSDSPWNPYVLAVASLIFNVISWIQLRYLESNVGIRNYIILRLSPRVKNALKALTDVEPPFATGVFAWEDEGIDFTYRKEKWLFPIMGSRIFLSLIAAGICGTVFLLIAPRNLSTVLWAALCFFAFSFSVWATLAVLRDVRTRPQP